jgi:hypothetical protein
VFDCPQGQEIHLLYTVSRPGLEPTQTPTQQVTEEISLRVNWLRHEANHSFTAKVKNEWNYISISSLILTV